MQRAHHPRRKYSRPILSQPTITILGVVLVLVTWLFVQYGTGSSAGKAFEIRSIPAADLDYGSVTLLAEGAPHSLPTAGFVSTRLEPGVPFMIMTAEYSPEERAAIGASLTTLQEAGALTVNPSPNGFTITLDERFEDTILHANPRGLWLLKHSKTYIVEFEGEPLATVMEPVETVVGPEGPLRDVSEPVFDTTDESVMTVVTDDVLEEKQPYSEIPEPLLVVQEDTSTPPNPEQPVPEIPLPEPSAIAGTDEETPPSAGSSTESSVPTGDEEALLTGYVVEGFESPRAYRQRLRDEQRLRINDINRRLRSEDQSAIKPVAEYTVAINAIVTDIDKSQVAIIRDSPGVKAVYPNMEVKALLIDAVPYVGAPRVWGRNASGDLCSVSDGDCLTGKGVTVAVIDTGIDYTHPDLGGCTRSQFLAGDCAKVIGGYDFTDDDNDPMDENGHGTHVAGIVAGNPTPGEFPAPTDRYYGIAPDATLRAYKVLDASGSGSYAGVIAGIEAAIEDRVDIMSLSLGGPGTPDDPISIALDNAMDAGILAVVAGGNSGPLTESIGAPGNSREALTVGAIDSEGVMARFSSRGPVLTDNEYFNKPDIVAPGVEVCSARLEGAYEDRGGCLDDGLYVPLSGTSMATPVVSGVAALMKQAFPELDGHELKVLLTSTATDLGYAPYEQGAGAVNAEKSLLSPLRINGNLDFDLSSSTSATKTLILENTGDTILTVSIEAETASELVSGDEVDIISIPRTIDLEPGASVPIEVTASIDPLTGGVFAGSVTMTVDGHTVARPYSVIRLATATVSIPEGFHPSVFLVRDDFLYQKQSPLMSDVSGSTLTFRIIPGDYYVVVVGSFFNPDFADFPGWESMEYVWADSLSVDFGSVASTTFEPDDLLKHTFQTRSKDGEPLELTQWNRGILLRGETYGFCPISYSCDDPSCHLVDGYCLDKAFAYSMHAGSLPQRTEERQVWVSPSPDDITLDVLVQYIGVP